MRLWEPWMVPMRIVSVGWVLMGAYSGLPLGERAGGDYRVAGLLAQEGEQPPAVRSGKRGYSYMVGSSSYILRKADKTIDKVMCW